MAQLRNLGQPFGGASQLINIPAPAGSQNAALVQMQAMASFGQAIGGLLGRIRERKLQKGDKELIQSYLQDVQNFPQQQQEFEQQRADVIPQVAQAFQQELGRGQFDEPGQLPALPQAPQRPALPALRSQRFGGLQDQALAAQAFGDPLQKQLTQSQIFKNLQVRPPTKPSLQLKDAGLNKVIFNPESGEIKTTNIPSTKLPATTINISPEQAQKSAEQDLQILREFENKATAENAKNPTSDVITVVKTDLKTGTRRLIKQPKPVASSAALTKIKSLLNIKKILDDVQIQFQPGFVGFADEFLGGVGEIIGTASPQEVSFRRNVFDIQDTILRERSGAAISIQEAQRLVRLAPDIGLGNKVFLPRNESLQGNINSRIQIEVDVLAAAGFKAKDLQDLIAGKVTIEQIKKTRSTAPSQIPNNPRDMTDEQIQAELRGL